MESRANLTQRLAARRSTLDRLTDRPAARSAVASCRPATKIGHAVIHRSSITRPKMLSITPPPEEVFVAPKIPNEGDASCIAKAGTATNNEREKKQKNPWR